MLLFASIFGGCHLVGGAGQTDERECPETCDIGLVSVTPEDGASDVPYGWTTIIAEVSYELSTVRADVIGPNGSVGTSSFFGTVQFAVDLEAETEYTIELSWSCVIASSEPCVFASTTFTTGDTPADPLDTGATTTNGTVGGPFSPDNVRGRVYRMTAESVADQVFGVGPVEFDTLFFVERANSSAMTAWMGTANAGGPQDPCTPPVSAESTLEADGRWHGTHAELHVFAEDYGPTIHARSWSGRFSGDGEGTFGGEIDWYYDAAEFAPYIGIPADGYCDLLASLGVTCTTCPEVVDTCVEGVATGLVTTVDPTPFTLTPDCDSTPYRRVLRYLGW